MKLKQYWHTGSYKDGRNVDVEEVEEDDDDDSYAQCTISNFGFSSVYRKRKIDSFFEHYFCSRLCPHLNII